MTKRSRVELRWLPALALGNRSCRGQLRSAIPLARFPCCRKSLCGDACTLAAPNGLGALKRQGATRPLFFLPRHPQRPLGYNSLFVMQVTLSGWHYALPGERLP